jgi:hypothetical protein
MELLVVACTQGTTRAESFFVNVGIFQPWLTYSILNDVMFKKAVNGIGFFPFYANC